jgi:hypothetical protein
MAKRDLFFAFQPKIARFRVVFAAISPVFGPIIASGVIDCIEQNRRAAPVKIARFGRFSAGNPAFPPDFLGKSGQKLGFAFAACPIIERTSTRLGLNPVAAYFTTTQALPWTSNKSSNSSI